MAGTPGGRRGRGSNDRLWQAGFLVGTAVGAAVTVAGRRAERSARAAGLVDWEQVEAIAKSDDPDPPGWAYFLDLWTETGPARLHIEGELEESGERITATLNDILP